MPEKNIHILSTSMLPDDAVCKASAHGMRIDVIPFFRIDDSSNKEIEEIVSVLALEKRTVVFTSKHAVRAVVRYLSKVPDWRIYCIDGATKKEITSFWDHGAIAGEAGNGKDLALKIIEKENRELVFFCGEQRLDTLPHILSEHNISLKELCVYKTLPTPRLIEEKYDGIFFFNPIGVHSFFSKNKAGKAVLFSIGETTAATIRSYTGNTCTIITATQSCKEVMVANAICYFENHVKNINGK